MSQKFHQFQQFWQLIMEYLHFLLEHLDCLSRGLKIQQYLYAHTLLPNKVEYILPDMEDLDCLVRALDLIIFRSYYGFPMFKPNFLYFFSFQFILSPSSSIKSSLIDV